MDHLQAQLPPLIRHPGHCHDLTLLSYPAYPHVYFFCTACGGQGNSFSYHCRICRIDIHIHCSFMQLWLYHQAHHHPLNLIFSPRYPNKLFTCNICRNMGFDHWLYHCGECGFDAHLGCAGGARRPLGQNQFIQSTAIPLFQPVMGGMEPPVDGLLLVNGMAFQGSWN